MTEQRLLSDAAVRTCQEEFVSACATHGTTDVLIVVSVAHLKRRGLDVVLTRSVRRVAAIEHNGLPRIHPYAPAPSPGHFAVLLRGDTDDQDIPLELPLPAGVLKRP